MHDWNNTVYNEITEARIVASANSTAGTITGRRFYYGLQGYKATKAPLMNGTADVGDSTKWAKEDHVHPIDTSRAASSHSHGNITNSGTITSTTISADPGDSILISDTSNSGKIERSLAFTNTGGGGYLSQLGSWTIPTQCSIVTQSASNTTYHINSRSQNNTIIKVTPNTSAGATIFSVDTEDTKSLTRFPLGGFLYIFINGAGIVHFTTDTGTATLYDGYEVRTLNTGVNAAATLLSSKNSTIIKLIRIGQTEWALENYNTGQVAYGGIIGPIESNSDIQPQYNNEILNVTKTCTLTVPASNKYITTAPYTGYFRGGFKCWIRCNAGTTTIAPASGITLRYFIPSTGATGNGNVQIRGVNGMAMLSMITDTVWNINGDIVTA